MVLLLLWRREMEREVGRDCMAVPVTAALRGKLAWVRMVG